MILFEHLNAPIVHPITSGEEQGKTEKAVWNQKTHIEKLASVSLELKTIYDSVCDFVESLGDDIAANQLKLYLAYKKVQNLVCIEIYNKQIVLYLKLHPDTVQLEKGFTRDMRNTGHYGTGDLQVIIRKPEDFEKAKPLLKRAYDEA